MSRHAAFARLALTALALGLLAGCAQQPVSVQEEQFYRLTVAPPAARPPPPVIDGVLEVERFLANGLLTDRAVAYARADAPDVLHQYRYHFWSDTPTRMLQLATVDYLRTARVAGGVVTPELRMDPRWVVSGRLLRFERIVDGSEARVALELDLALRDVEADALLFHETYRDERPC
ncbi:MAG: ABC-type transport auxiliary lipoprotein family protein, partial [Gammaproteobacteria bacterium]|nr:ABC-type transport auxiliary lipoprotein family protein [Gammaproteobacteria bacterium]